MRKRWSAIIRSHVRISEGEKIDPRGLGTQLYSAASPNQVFYNTKVIKINACLGHSLFGNKEVKMTTGPGAAV